jgi:hypothetical protein
MIRLVRARAIGVLLVTAVAALSGCGGAGGLAAGTVADVGGAPITASDLNHWVGTITGGDFTILGGVHVPRDLVSETFSAGRCERELLALTTDPAKPANRPTVAWLGQKCQELRVAIRRQALQELIAANVGFGRGSEEGLSVTPAELKAELRRYEREQFKSSTEFAAYLAARDWSVADELLIIKKDVVSQRLNAKAAQRFSGPGKEAARVAHSKEEVAKWVAKTVCRPGFVVEGCKGYTSKMRGAEGRSAAVLVEEIARRHPHTEKVAPDINCKNTASGGVSCHDVGKKK